MNQKLQPGAYRGALHLQLQVSLTIQDRTYDNQALVDIIENQNRAIKRLELEVQRLSKPTPGTQKGKAKEK